MPREAPQFAYFSSAYEMVNMPLQPNVSTLMIRDPVGFLSVPKPSSFSSYPELLIPYFHNKSSMITKIVISQMGQLIPWSVDIGCRFIEVPVYRGAGLSSLDRVKMMRVEPLASLIPQALVIEPSSELTFRVCIATLVLTNPSARTVFFKENLYPSKLSDIRQILLRI
uniref:Uncharacterized protein n=1 Tax=Ditylenchus dipsaci TaxID=166011 RepID=A0A915EN86_9BILA